jgi:hypothetical protein
MDSLPEIRPKFRLHLAAAGDNTTGDKQHDGVGVEEARPAAVCNDLVSICRITR